MQNSTQKRLSSKSTNGALKLRPRLRTGHVPAVRLAAFAALCFLFAACGETDIRRATDEAVLVETMSPRPRSGAGAIAFSGTIEASETFPLSFAAVGTVARVFVSEGDPVRRGQLLAVLDTTSAREALEMALATLAQAEDAHARLKPMAKNATLPEIRMAEMEAELARARASAAIARKNLRDCELRSPVDGVVGGKTVEPGMNAVPNLTSVTVMRIGRVFARIAVPENEIASVKRGQCARARVSALGDREYAGAVEEIGVVADAVSHSYPVRIVLHNDGAMKPGMICAVRLENASRDGAGEPGVVVPSEAVMVDEAGAQYVFIVKNGRAARRMVETDGFAEEGIIIRNGLSPADAVVLRGQHKLVDGTAVRSGTGAAK